MYYLKTYPLSFLCILAIACLSFCKPPQTVADTIPYIDKAVHICMYAGLTAAIWFEYLRHHRIVKRLRLTVGTIVLSTLMGGCIEIVQGTCTDNRSADWFDFLANCLGSILACIVGNYAVLPLLRRK